MIIDIDTNFWVCFFLGSLFSFLDSVSFLDIQRMCWLCNTCLTDLIDWCVLGECLLVLEARVVGDQRERVSVSGKVLLGLGLGSKEILERVEKAYRPDTLYFGRHDLCLNRGCLSVLGAGIQFRVGVVR